MSSFYDDASLVVIPSGYKTSKVYAEKPTDGSGDLTFTRTGDTATRVNSAGLIEKVRTNLVTYSEDFTNAAWNNVNQVTITANAGVSPNGTTTADRLLSTGSSWFFSRIISLTSGTPYTISVYVKSNTASSQTFRLFGNNSDFSSNLTATTSWQRFSFTITASIGSLAQGIARDSSNSAVDLLVWGFQLETGDVPTAYIPTTTAAVSVGPVANVPRLDYLGSTCPRLLLEPQRTNNALYSEQLDNAAWTKQNTTVTANVVTSPSGYQDADKLVETSATGVHRASVSSAATLNGTYSFFAKSGERTKVAILSTTIDLGFDLSNGTLIDLGSGTSGGKIENYGNGWYRCSLPQASGIVALALALLDNANNVFYAGDGTSGAYFWGAQLEAATYATSYIPTLASASTRSADACSKTGISSLIGQTEGTVFVEFKRVPKGVNYQAVVTLQGASSAYLIEMYFGSANTLLAAVYNSGQQFQSATSALSEGTYKAALAYKENDFAFYLNGVQISTDNSGTVPALSTFNLGDFTYSAGLPQNDGINQALLFKTRLTNAELAELTTL